MNKTIAEPYTLPHSKNSEMIVLGCMLNHLDHLNTACELLQEKDFYIHEHQKIFHILFSFYQQDKACDLHLLSEELKRQNLLEEIGGINYLITLSQGASTAILLEEYAELVKEKAILRRMIHGAQSIEQKAFSQPPDVYEALDEAQRIFFHISQSSQNTEGVLVSRLLAGSYKKEHPPFLEVLQKKQEEFKLLDPKASKITGLSTGFYDIDKLTNGLNNSHLLIIAGRPAMGKTALALNFAEHVCFKLKQPVAIFSLEMTAEQLLHRLICSQAEVESEKIRTGSLNGYEFQRIASAVAWMQEQTMIIDDQPGLKITDLKARARRLKESYDIQLLVIDYLQLLSGSGALKSVDNRQNEISEISRWLKTLARELNIPIVCASQLSRKVEERAGHRPLMSDLRESGSIEQDADLILLLLRPEYYDPKNHPGMAEIIVAKNRHGSVGNVKVAFLKEFALFRNFAFETPQDPFE